MAINPDELLTVAQAAAILGVSNQRVWKWVKEGRIKVLRPGLPILIIRSELKRPEPIPMDQRKLRRGGWKWHKNQGTEAGE